MANTRKSSSPVVTYQYISDRIFEGGTPEDRRLAASVFLYELVRQHPAAYPVSELKDSIVVSQSEWPEGEMYSRRLIRNVEALGVVFQD